MVFISLKRGVNVVVVTPEGIEGYHDTIERIITAVLRQGKEPHERRMTSWG